MRRFTSRLPYPAFLNGMLNVMKRKEIKARGTAAQCAATGYRLLAPRSRYGLRVKATGYRLPAPGSRLLHGNLPTVARTWSATLAGSGA